MYPDDTQVFASSNDANNLILKWNTDFEHVKNSLIQNKILVHPTKSNFMLAGSSYNMNNMIFEHPVVVNNTPVSQTDTHECLGGLIDKKRTWDSHIDIICKKASAGIGAKRRIRPFVPSNSLEKVYKSLVQPYFDYCSPL